MNEGDAQRLINALHEVRDALVLQAAATLWQAHVSGPGGGTEEVRECT
jgi:hypothetical protein